MANKRVGGIIFFNVEGTLYQAKGNFTYNLGQPKREAIIGADGVHGFKELPQAAVIEGMITDSDELDLQTLVNLRDVTATLQLANGKVVVVEEAFYAADGNATTEEGEIEIRFEGVRGREVV